MSNPFIAEPLEPRLQFAATPLLPDMVAVASKANDFLYGWSLQTTPHGERLIRFSMAIGNAGKGPLDLFGGKIVKGKQQVFQRIFRSDGTSFTRLAGTFSTAEAKEVYFDDFARFSLAIRTDSNGVGKVIRQSPKRSCCVGDEIQFNPNLPGSPSTQMYEDCTDKKQGVSVGWADVYHSTRAGQYINITGVKPGRYWLQVTANPDLKILESNNTNNTVRIPIVIK